MLLVDSHAHLDMPDFDADRDEVIARAKRAGIGVIITIGIDLESSRKAIELAARHPQVYATAGFHPHDASKMSSGDLAELEKLCQDNKVIAIGEIGLDFYRNLSPRERQLAAFGQQLGLAEKLRMPVVVHSREAHQETADILIPWAERQHRLRGGSRTLGVLHCFSGDKAQAEEYYRQGFLISVAGTVTYPTAHVLAEVVRDLPLEALLVETDCPFLTPHPYRGRRNEPFYVTLTRDRVAEIKGLLPEEVDRITTENAQRLFALSLA